LSLSKPVMRQEMPNGRRPLDWVYRCLSEAIYLKVGFSKFSALFMYIYVQMFEECEANC
jgi:hypothetical protein